MNILHITAFDKGGAGTSVVRVHESLLKKGVSSKILVKRKFSKTDKVYEFNKDLISLMKYYLAQARKKYFLKVKGVNPDYFSDFRIGLDITKSKEFQEADIIHLHWISEFVDYKKLVIS